MALACAFACLLALGAGTAPALVLPPGFQGKNLDIPKAEAPSDFATAIYHPTAIEFGPGGRMWVAEQHGGIKVFDDVDDATPTLAADLTADVMGRGDRGLLGLELDPEYPAQPYMYLAYTHDAPIGGEAPFPPGNPGEGDFCQESAPYTDCVASGRIVSIELNPATGIAVGGSGGGAIDPPQNELVESYCQQFMSHSIGDVEFDSEGALLAGGGDGAMWDFPDNGTRDEADNVCQDPEFEGGQFRSQDLLTPDSLEDPTDYNGTIIRIDRFTGEALPTNPLFGGADVPARRVIASGLRNPFRFEFRPGTSEVYIGDVGWATWEEINLLTSPPGSQALNFGWPCYEGEERQPEWEAIAGQGEAPLCSMLYGMGPGAVTSPLFKYLHDLEGFVAPGDTCAPPYGASITGIGFYDPGAALPENAFPDFDGSMFFADASRGCLWSVDAAPDGKPDFTDIATFATPEEGELFTPVDVTVGPDGALYIPNFFDDTIVVIRYFVEGSRPPRARLSADKTFGAASVGSPLQIQFDASASTDPESEALHYTWDLDGDGAFDDGSDAPVVSRQYTASANVAVRVRVEDGTGNADVSKLTVYPGDLAPPVPELTVTGDNWEVGQLISFEAEAADSEAVSVQVSVNVRHCPTVTACHSHPLTNFFEDGTTPGQLAGQLFGPPHELPSHLLLTLTARDQRGLTATVSRQVHPNVVDVELASTPAGIPLSLNGKSTPAPSCGQVIDGGNATLSAPLLAEVNGALYEFEGWSDEGARSRTITVSADTALTATYKWIGGDEPQPEEKAPAACAPPEEEEPPTEKPPGEKPPTETPPGGEQQPRTNLVPIHVRSKPPGVRLQVDAFRRRAPFEFAIAESARFLAVAPKRATVRGKRLHFRRWNNGGPRRQWVTVGGVKMLCAIYRVERPGRKAR